MENALKALALMAAGLALSVAGVAYAFLPALDKLRAVLAAVG